MTIQAHHFGEGVQDLLGSTPLRLTNFFLFAITACEYANNSNFCCAQSVSQTSTITKQGLKSSLLKNIQEIKNVALSKILKNLQLNFNSFDSRQLQYYSNILKDNNEYYQQFIH